MQSSHLPPGYNFLQSLSRTYKQVKDPIGTIEESMERFGGTYSVNLGFRKLIATQDTGFIDHVLRGNHKNYYKSPMVTEQLGRFIGNGLLTSNGEYWLKQRRLIQPGFHADKIHALYSIIKNTIDDFLTTFPVGDCVDVYPHMNALAFEIVINTLFNIKVPQEDRQRISGFISETQDFVIKDIRQPHMSWWFKLSGEVKDNLKKATISRDIIRKIIRERKATEKKFNDLLDMLLDARYEDTGEAMHEDQIIDEILILIIAGHETTANALSWSLYLLANNPQTVSWLKEETDSLSLMDTVANKKLDAVVKESMRLYPPAWISDRVSLKDDVYKDYKIEAGTIVVLFYYGLHRDSHYWSNAIDFLPERFLNSAADTKDKPKAYYPFGGGPRLCIGSNFAMAEMTIFLQAAVKQFTFTPTNVQPVIKPLITLRPDKVILGVKRI